MRPCYVGTREMRLTSPTCTQEEKKHGTFLLIDFHSCYSLRWVSGANVLNLHSGNNLTNCFAFSSDFAVDKFICPLC